MIKFSEFLDNPGDAVMIKTSYRVDLKRLREFFHNEVKPLDKIYQGAKTWHGGWSVQSNSGDIYDGWQPGGSLVKRNEAGNFEIDPEARKAMFPDGNEFRTPTALYKGIMEEMLMELESGGFVPKRTRFAELEPGGRDGWHKDGIKGPFWRGHIAVETNPDCLFWWSDNNRKQTISRHIPADGHLYMLRIDTFHRITNLGSTDRTHILVDPKNNLRNSQFRVEPQAFLPAV